MDWAGPYVTKEETCRPQDVKLLTRFLFWPWRRVARVWFILSYGSGRADRPHLDWGGRR